jgi:hypothetical protein
MLRGEGFTAIMRNARSRVSAPWLGANIHMRNAD